MEKRSNEPLVWPLFAAGGQLTAILTPVMVLMTGIIVPAGIFPQALNYDRMLAVFSNPFWGLILAVVISLTAWHALYRLYRTLFDLGVRKSLGICEYLCFGGAILISIVSFVLVIILAIG